MFAATAADRVYPLTASVAHIIDDFWGSFNSVNLRMSFATR